MTVAATTTGLLVGVAFAAPAAFATTPNPDPSAGSRNGATQLPFSISGTASLSVDVGTGNAQFNDQLFTLPGVRSDVPVTLSYNSSVFGTSTPSSVTNSNGSGWALSGFDERMVTNADGSVTFYGPGGLTGVFASAGGGTFTPPSQFQTTLTGTQSTGYTLTNHASQEVLAFNSSGRLTSDTDRDGNATTYSYSSGYPSMITSSRGPTTVRQLQIATTSGRITSMTQYGVGSVTRSVSIGYSSGGHLASITDTAGGVTSFDSNPEGSSGPGTDTGQVVHIKSPGNSSTYFTFASGGQVASVSQTNPVADGGAGESVTRLTYPSSTQTLEADPTTNQSQSVSTVPHTTYTIGTGNLVTNTQDPDNNSRADTYTSLGDIATDTPAAGGTTTYSYPSNVNNGESLTKVASPGGATDSAAYGNTGAKAYLPSSTTDDASNATQYTYDGSGNQQTTAQGTGQQATVTYNSNGAAATSASPGAATGQNTTYTYDSTTHNLTSITPPSNSSLGSRSYTYDAFDRLQTATDGKGDTTTYTYDNLDRITQVSYSDGTHAVNYTYSATGQITRRVDGSGTTTYTYDDLGHLLSTSNTANGNTVSYTYDLAGDLATVTDGLGTTTYGYDAAHELTSMSYPQNGMKLTTFANNANGQRTDVWLQSNATHTVWAAHEHLTYDSSGRVSTVLGENGPATGPTTVENETLCYATGVTPQNCSSAPPTADRSNVQSTYESVSGETNTYTYDDHDRLTKDVVTGGSNPRTYTYGYDQAGNRTSSSVTGSSPTSQSLTYNAGNQISSTGYTYDGAGDLTTSPTRTATFNGAGQQTSTTVSGQTSTYTYAGTNENEVLSETVGSQSKTYSMTYGRPDANGLPEVDSVSVSGVGTGYVLSDPSGEPVMLATSSGVTCLYLYDGIHNPVGLSTSSSTTSQAFRYDPYGGSTTTNNSGFSASYENPFTFGEGLVDRATGEIKFGQRFYSTSTGGWTQQDALNAPLDPQNANRYEYSADNPINRTDPSGADNGDSCAQAPGECKGAPDAPPGSCPPSTECSTKDWSLGCIIAVGGTIAGTIFFPETLGPRLAYALANAGAAYGIYTTC